MTEQELMAKHQKRKDRIKNIAIIFLVIMLLLTFFSNTIMNYSLAEVGTAYASSGTLTTKIRGDASVEAKDPVKIVTDQEAKVLKVLVKNGDKVKKGKTLFVLEGASSEELEQAMNDLVTMNYDYQKALLDIKVPDYAKNNSDIKYARKDLKQALKEIDDIKQENKEKKLEYKKLAKDAEKAKEDMDAKADLVADKEEEIANLQVVLDGYDAEITALSSTEENDTVLEKQDAVTQAERAVEDAEEAEAQYEITDGRTSSVIQGEVKAQEQVIADLQDELSEQQEALNDLLSSNAKSNDKIATHSKEISSIRSKINSIEGN